MRVISQDGAIDVPYENSVVFINTRGVRDKAFVRMQTIGDNEASIMAQYSSEEKAKKAMEELRYAYMCHSLVKMGQTPPDGIDENIDEKLTMGLSGVFRFPAEEELE